MPFSKILRVFQTISLVALFILLDIIRCPLSISPESYSDCLICQPLSSSISSKLNLDTISVENVFPLCWILSSNRPFLLNSLSKSTFSADYYRISLYISKIFTTFARNFAQLTKIWKIIKLKIKIQTHGYC